MRAKQVFDLEHALALGRRALSEGATAIIGDQGTHVKWDIAGRCEAARAAFIEGYVPAPLNAKADGAPLPRMYRLALAVPCRKCKPCLWARRIKWTERAIRECLSSSRTWFGSLTLEPGEQHKCLLAGIGALPDAPEWNQRVHGVKPLLTKYLKRVRKESAAKFRYVAVFEAHKSGLPHLHLLLHEGTGHGEVRKATLQSQWPHGFTSWKLADVQSARYLCKYLSKSCDARVRASHDYGTRSLNVMRETHTGTNDPPNEPPPLNAQGVEEAVEWLWGLSRRVDA